LVARKVRDIYGNWVWEDTDDASTRDGSEATHGKISQEEHNTANDDRSVPDKRRGRAAAKSVKLEWKDYIALTLASLQTVLVPIIVMIVLLIVVALILAH
jgi:hypothetical protein